MPTHTVGAPGTARRDLSLPSREAGATRQGRKWPTDHPANSLRTGGEPTSRPKRRQYIRPTEAGMQLWGGETLGFLTPSWQRRDKRYTRYDQFQRQAAKTTTVMRRLGATEEPTRQVDNNGPRNSFPEKREKTGETGRQRRHYGLMVGWLAGPPKQCHPRQFVQVGFECIVWEQKSQWGQMGSRGWQLGGSCPFAFARYRTLPLPTSSTCFG